jgi:solute carrier family 20 (sodium-dependent phosphate transporter)
VGSGVLTFRQACILATFCETTGSVLLGYKVSDTIRKNILDITEFVGFEEELMLGMLAILFGSVVWMFVATFFRLPVSTTHSMVGSTIGFALVSRIGADGIKYEVLGNGYKSVLITFLLIFPMFFWG